MSNQELLELTKKIARDDFKMEFTDSIFFNSRLKTTGGRFHPSDCHIDMNPKMLAEHDEDTLIGTIKHELCHYFLFKQKMPYNHASREFKILLKQVGGLRYAPTAVNKTYKYLYQCQNCQQQYHRQKRMNTARYVCGKCRGKLKLIQNNSILA